MRPQGNREAVAPMLLELLQRANQACPVGAAAQLQGPRVHGVPAAVLTKEAVYQVAAGDPPQQLDARASALSPRRLGLQRAQGARPAAPPAGPGGGCLRAA